MQSFPSISEVVRYLRTQPVGSQCILTGGTAHSRKLGNEFFQRGIRISHSGPHGNRVITLVAVDTSLMQKHRDYLASKAVTNQYLIGQIKKNGGIPAHEPTYVQGNKKTLVRQLLKYVGKDNYSAKQVKNDPRGLGWMVTVKLPIFP